MVNVGMLHCFCAVHSGSQVVGVHMAKGPTLTAHWNDSDFNQDYQSNTLTYHCLLLGIIRPVLMPVNCYINSKGLYMSFCLFML